MTLEIEAKFRVEMHDPVRQRLQGLGAARRGCVRESNHIFDNADRTLLATDRGLRVRALTIVDGPARPPTLTYKGPRTDAAFKTREEIETAVTDADATCRILASLGFVEVLVFEKRRETWELADCLVELDELPHLGRYVEVEGPGEASVERARVAIGLEHAAPIRASYIAMLVDHCRRHGLDTRRIALTA